MRHLSQSELAALLDRSKGWLAKIEIGTNGIGAADLRDVASTLRLPIAYFYGEDEQMIPGLSALTAAQRDLVVALVAQLGDLNARHS